MRRRLLVSTGLIALAAVLLLGLPLGLIGSRLLEESATGRLEREADRAAARIAEARAHGEALDGALLAALAAPGHRLDARLPDGRIVSGGDRVSGARLRVHAGNVTGGVRVTVVAPRNERTERIGGVWLAVAVLSLIAIAVAVGLALVQARRLAGPLERLARRATAVGHAGFDRRPTPTGVEELDAVEHALVEADERIAALLQREREFSANASHQLRSPLTGLRMRLEELQATAGTAEARDEATAALAQVDRLLATIAELEALARAQEADGAPADLAGVVRAHTRTAWALRFAATGRELRVDAPGAALVRLAEEPLRQLLDVLLDNALRHGAGTTTVAAEATGPWARLAVQDEGPGVPAGQEESVFERHRSLAGGTGVGLALARELARRAGGELRLTRPSRFEARLPVAR
jgi:signal transduction histidine kinase